MLHKFLGFFDVICIIPLIWLDLNIGLTLACALYLIVKGVSYLLGGDFISALDILAGAYILFLLAGISNLVITLIAIIFLAQKGIFSMIS
jgi:hypothetical protein